MSSYIIIKSTIIPYFTLKKGVIGTSQRVSRDKLVNLWMNRRKKAFDEIRKDGIWPINESVTITTERNEQYYNSSDKYVMKSVMPDHAFVRYFSVG